MAGHGQVGFTLSGPGPPRARRSGRTSRECEQPAADRPSSSVAPGPLLGCLKQIDLHTRGNIEGFRRARGPRKLQMRGPINAWAANAEFNGVELHEKVLLPFYERFLKGKDTEWEKRPPVEYFVRGANVFRAADTWPPA